MRSYIEYCMFHWPTVPIGCLSVIVEGMNSRKHERRLFSQSDGFTVVELIIAILFLAGAGTLFLIQKQNVEAINRDAQRKIAINAMYYNLKEVYFAANKSYPRVINATNLKAMDPALFKDPNGKAAGEQDSNYRYLPSGCNGDVCTGFMLRTILERESDYIKQND